MSPISLVHEIWTVFFRVRQTMRRHFQNKKREAFAMWLSDKKTDIQGIEITIGFLFGHQFPMSNTPPYPIQTQICHWDLCHNSIWFERPVGNTSEGWDAIWTDMLKKAMELNHRVFIVSNFL